MRKLTKFRLKVRVSKNDWRTGLVVYNTYEEAENRKKELRAHRIESIIVDEFGGYLK